MNPSNEFLPVVLVRGFDLFGSSVKTAFYGWDEGTVYPYRLGDDFVYEGMIVKFLKTRFRSPASAGVTRYEDATNAVCYRPLDPDRARLDEYGAIEGDQPAPPTLASLARLLGKEEGELSAEERSWIREPTILDPGIAKRFTKSDLQSTLWVYRYFDYRHRDVRHHAVQLGRLVDMIRATTGAPAVNLVCHSMGGVMARYLIQRVYLEQANPGIELGTEEDPVYPDDRQVAAGRAHAEERINRWVTLGTPHRGIPFQILPGDTFAETEYFRAETLERRLRARSGIGHIADAFDPSRVLCVAGTNHWTYAGVAGAAGRVANELVSLASGTDLNHSDGLVKQESAVLDGTPKAYVHKCHSGEDSIITSRESFELVARFLFGDVFVRVRLDRFRIRERQDSLLRRLGQVLDGQPEYYVGFSVKPRGVDFFLNQMSKEAENCFGPLHASELDAGDFMWDPSDRSRDGTVFEGFLNSALGHYEDDRLVDLAFRLDTYVGERDAFLLHHSDATIARRQSFVVVKMRSKGFPDIEFIPDVRKEDGTRTFDKVGEGRYRLSLDFGEIDPGVALDLSLEIGLSREFP